MKSTNSYVTFSGNCREAMGFYQTCFGGELNLLPVADSPMADQWPADSRGDILHACLTSGALTLMASDGAPNTSPSAEGALPVPYVSISVNCESDAELERLFQNLSEGGKIVCPLGNQFWGAKFGALTDKYGVSWLLSYDKE